MDTIAMWIGYAIMLACGVAIAAGALIWAGMLSNRASKWCVDAYGGWIVFLEFREWYHNVRPKVDDGGTAPEGHNAKSEPTAPLLAQVGSTDGLEG